MALGWPPSEILSWDLPLYQAALVELEDQAAQRRMDRAHRKRWGGR